MLCAVLALFLFAQSQAAPTPTTHEDPPALIVEVVDHLFQPLSEVTVVAKRRGKSLKDSTVTGVDGQALFWIPVGAEYDIEATRKGFEKGRAKKVRVTERPTARVKIQLSISIPTLVP